MLTFNSILREENIDPKQMRLVRHQDTRPGHATPYNLWRVGDGSFETYQQIQRRGVFPVPTILASFVATPGNQTLFVGLFRVEGVSAIPEDAIDPSTGSSPGTESQFYDIHKDQRLSEFIGRLTVEWGKGFRAWVQHAETNEKPVLEIRTDSREERFPGFTDFRWDIDQIESVPLSWQEVLKAVKGVYLLACKDTGKQYVGSAKGEDSLWGRFLQYSNNGHGGNVEMKSRGRGRYQVTVLEVVNSDTGIERIEEAWKRKLLSREFGLNKN